MAFQHLHWVHVRITYADPEPTGASHTAKLALLHEELKKKGAKATVVNMLDEVAWLFNLRGSDIDFNPGAPRIPHY